MKKAFELEFHWIFIMIAGALILVFFFTLAQKLRTVSEENRILDVSRELDHVFSAAISAKRVSQQVSLPKGGISFECSQVCDCYFRLGSKTTSFKDSMIFAPNKLVSNTAQVWAFDWKLPYRITNFLFISEPSLQYVFVADPQQPHSRALQQKLAQDIPQTIHATFVTPHELPQQPLGQTRIVYLGIPPPATPLLGLPDSFRTTQVSGLFINAEQRKLVFYTQRNQELISTEATYAGDAAVYAAIFTTDPQVYSCGMTRALAKAAHITEVYAARAQALTNDMSALQRSDCIYPESFLQEFLQAINAQSTAITPNLIPLEVNAQQVTKENENLRLQSCPVLY